MKNEIRKKGATCDNCGYEALTTIINKDGSRTVHCSFCGYEYTTH